MPSASSEPIPTALLTVPVNAGPGTRSVDGIQDREQLVRLVAVSERREGHDGPDRGVRVLAAILTYPGWVALYVAGIEGSFVERGIE